VRTLVLATVVFVTLAAGAVHQAGSFAAESDPDFGRDIVPILENNCLRCHNTAKSEGGLLLESYEDVMRGGDSGVAVVAGKPDESPLLLQVEGPRSLADTAGAADTASHIRGLAARWPRAGDLGLQGGPSLQHAGGGVA
jgi:hypothetical protein